MTKKERVKRILKFEEADIVPYNLGFTVPAYRKMANYYKDENFTKNLGCHLVSIQARTDDAWQEIGPNLFQDEFGAIWDRSVDKDIGTVRGCVLPEPTLGSYKFPDPYKRGSFIRYETFIKENDDKFLLHDISFSLFERAWILRGMENFLQDMILNPRFVEELLDKILEFNLAILDHALEYKIDGCQFGDDWGQQRGLIMGPGLWRKFIKPRLAKMYSKVKGRGLKVFIHSCGDVKEILPDLIEIGVDVLNPFQPEAMDVYEVKKKYGKNLAFFGGISTQHTLPHGTPSEIKSECKRLIEIIGSGGGYIIAPAHSIPGDVPVENMLALIEALMAQ